MITAIIPARGGSTRIPEKNIKLFEGKPVIAYTIEAARKTEIFDKIIVSTDSEKIAEIARRYGAETPFIRPSELGENKVSVAKVVYHAIEWLQNKGNNVEWACCLVACAPLIKPEFIVDGYNLLIKQPDLDAVISMAKYPHSVFRAFKKNDNGTLNLIYPEHEFSNSNDLPHAYHDAAQFYWLNVKKFMKTKSILNGKILPITIPQGFVVDIDTPDDWEKAEILYEVCRKKGLL
jgi:pseudaminic acid cytidylyltransferase